MLSILIAFSTAYAQNLGFMSSHDLYGYKGRRINLKVGSKVNVPVLPMKFLKSYSAVNLVTQIQTDVVIRPGFTMGLSFMYSKSHMNVATNFVLKYPDYDSKFLNPFDLTIKGIGYNYTVWFGGNAPVGTYYKTGLNVYQLSTDNYINYDFQEISQSGISVSFEFAVGMQFVMFERFTVDLSSYMEPCLSDGSLIYTSPQDDFGAGDSGFNGISKNYLGKTSFFGFRAMIGIL